MRELVPNRWRHWVKQRLPLALQDWLTTFWRVGRVDWSATRAFCLVADVQGYVRLDLRGREAEGIVAPGDEYDRLGAEIAAGLSTFVDGASGMPVVHEVVRADRLYQTGARRDLLPDLIVQWARTPRAPERSVRSPRYGAIALPLPGKNADGRSGNHRPHGFLLAAGPGVGAGPLGEAPHHGPRTDGVCAVRAGAAGGNAGAGVGAGCGARRSSGTSHPERSEGAMNWVMAPSPRSG